MKAAAPTPPVAWLTAFLDFPTADLARGVGFWQAVTGYGLSPWRGSEGEFATLLPPDGDSFLRVQRIGAAVARVHLDLHSVDVQAIAARARELGARERQVSDVAVFDSPGGMTFCVVDAGDEAVAPRARQWPAGQRSRPDQVCLDIPRARYDAEVRFWSDLTGWNYSDSPTHGEFGRLTGAGALTVLTQRLDDEDGQVTAHLDLACDDSEKEAARHAALGAARQYDGDGWITMADPAGQRYCITSRPPEAASGPRAGSASRRLRLGRPRPAAIPRLTR